MLNIGDTVLVVSANGNEPKLFKSVVETVDPLSILIYNPSGQKTFGVGMPVNLIWRGVTSDSHTSARIEKLSKYGLSSILTLTDYKWTEFDRRRDTRFDVQLWGEVSVVSETDEGTSFLDIRGQIDNLSNVGCWFTTEESLSPGTLVAVTIQNPNSIDPWRMLAVVTRTSDVSKGFGMEFFDFLGSTRTTLCQFLSSLEDKAA